ncbi:cysteine synthase A [Facklamia sp. DSM 111018]|uniref:Cysteine synthase A n=1 Tax=Facklamia lactis TaxID=2749967 RepID=A0ABS0LPP4_9LACT|nr:cysteine synthase A [Facklamia lactis]MBG9980315.1 cysteine synthase A [Facklamia lactis]MBG9986118.1 cysteine synthase A [Facklamia lactis]
MLYNNVVEAIGNTPLIKINGLSEESAEIYVKLERSNPSGSVKDRPVKYILKAMMEQGELKEGGTIIEPTSGNTGIGLAMAGAALGLKVIIVMPDSMSVERRQLMAAYGAELVLTPAADGAMKAAKAKAEELSKELNAPILGQFAQTANIQAHEETTAQEILKDLEQVDGFVAGIGTSGTIVGVGNVLKSRDANIKIIAVEPEASPLISKGQAASHKIQGLGANFIPEIYQDNNIDDIYLVSNEDAIAHMKELAKNQGILSGISSGANYCAAKKLAKELGKGKKVVTVLPDTGERYLSTGLFNENE